MNSTDLANRKCGNRKLRFFLNVLAAALTLAIAAPRAGATTLAPLSLTQMARAADAIVRARCTGVASHWEQGSIWTISDFEVLEQFKGAPPGSLQVLLPGGRVGHLQMSVEGAPRFVPGEEGVLFLEKTARGGYSVTGWAQGTFRIRHRSGAGEPLVTQDSSGFPVFNTVTRKFNSEGIHNLPLDQFRGRLATALAQGQAQAQGGSKP